MEIFISAVSILNVMPESMRCVEGVNLRAIAKVRLKAAFTKLISLRKESDAIGRCSSSLFLQFILIRIQDEIDRHINIYTVRIKL